MAMSVLVISVVLFTMAVAAVSMPMIAMGHRLVITATVTSILAVSFPAWNN